MLIGELSKKTGFSRDTIRYYEKFGLISKGNSIDRYSSYKDYPETVLKRLLAIRKIKEFGFTLKEMQALFILFEEGALEPDRGRRYVKRKIAFIDSKISDLLIVKNRLEEISNADEPGQCPLDKILEEMTEA
jgi:DNA-binding transcriptional MerR regulator